MRKLKKTTAAILVAAMACSMLTACGKKDDNESTTQGTTATTAKTEGTTAATEGTTAATEGTTANDASGEDVGTITVMGIDWGYGPKQNSDMEQWWEQDLGVDLEVDWVSYKDYSQKLNTLLASGKQDDIPDVVQINKTDNSFYYPVFAQAIDAGVFVNLDDYLNGPDGLIANNDVMKNWSDTIWENASYNGHVYILPRSTCEVANNSGVTVRRDLMREHGMEEEPKTMEELQTWLIELAQKSGLYALEFSEAKPVESARLSGFATAFTGQAMWGLDAEGNYVYQPFADGYIDFLNWMKEFYSLGLIDPEFILAQTDVSKWKAGKSVATLSSWYSWNQSEDKTTNRIFDKNMPDTYEAWCLELVKGPKGYTLNIDPYGFDAAIAINSKCSDAKIRKILEAFNKTGEDYMEVLLYGVEGMHYDWVDGARISSDEQATKKSEGYVGAWNQIFLKADVDVVNQKFMRGGAQNASQEAIDRAYLLKKQTEEGAKEMGLNMANLNLVSETYNSNWSTLIADCNDMVSRYIMNEIDEEMWFSYVDSIVNSPEYKAINEEYKAAAASK